MNTYRSKNVFITGGSSGIGKAVARLLIQWGANIVIGARRETMLDQALAELEPLRSGNKIARVVIDIADRGSVHQAVGNVLATLGSVDVLINNAGIAHPGYIEVLADEVFDTMMRVNYFGTVNVTRALLPHFMSREKGHICNVSSLLGFMGIFGYTAYAASKFAITGFSDCLRQELLSHNIGVSVVFPPDTDTPQLHEENRIKPAETKAIARSVKVMKADEVARAMLAGIAAGHFHIVPGIGAKYTYFMYRHFPSLVRLVIDTELRRARKCVGSTR
jgi:3-dehydrosphinganine reductase